MKNIELTKNQEIKLLEMCKKLFPEVQIWTGMLPDGSQAPERVLDFPMDLEWGTEWDLPYISVKMEQIHWFEFCWKILNKLMSNEEKTNPVHVHECVVNFGMICFNNSGFQHPIDYLYEIFKQNEKS